MKQNISFSFSIIILFLMTSIIEVSGQNSPIQKYKTGYLKNNRTFYKKDKQTILNLYSDIRESINNKIDGLKKNQDATTISSANNLAVITKTGEDEYTVEESTAAYYNNEFSEATIDYYQKLIKDKTHILDSLLNKQTLLIARAGKKTEDDNAFLISVASQRKEIDAVITKYDNIIDSLNGERILLHKLSWGFSPVFHGERGFASAFNNYYYGKNSMATLQNVVLETGDGITNLNTELVSDYIHTFRFGLSADLTASKSDASVDSKKKTEIQRFLSAGGQVALHVSTPILLLRSKNEKFHFIISCQEKVGFNVLSVDSISKDFMLNSQTGGEVHLDFATNNNKLNFFVELPFAYICGSPKFYSYFDFRDFSVGQIAVGFTAMSQFRIKFTGPVFSTQKSLLHQPFRVALQLTAK